MIEPARSFTHNTIVFRTFQGQSGTWYACFVNWRDQDDDRIGTGDTEMQAIIDLCQQEQDSMDTFIESLIGDDND